MLRASTKLCVAFLVCCQLISKQMALPINSTSLRPNRNRNAVQAADLQTTHCTLYSKCSKGFLQILGRKMNAKANNKSDPYTELKLTSESSLRIRIQSSATGAFVCFNRKAKLIVKHNGDDERCYFRETLGQLDTEFQSDFNHTWYIGFKQNGVALNGSHSKKKSYKKCRKFVKIPSRTPRPPITFDFNELQGKNGGSERHKT